MIADMLNGLLRPEQTTTVLLETMAGKGSEVGGSFSQLREILDRVELGDKMGVCFDTCHVWDAGYDIEKDLDGVLTEFDKVVGLDRLRAVHLNNSMNPCGSRKDRHAKLREGKMAPETILRTVCHPALAGRPFILETPNDDRGYADEIAWVRGEWEKRR
jgi:deoxyribonuclease-4